MTDTKNNRFDGVAVAIFVLEPDPDGVLRYTLWNSSAEMESGLLRSAVLGKTALDVYPGSLGEAEYQRHVNALRTAEMTTYDVMPPFQGASTWWRTTLKPERDTSGNILRIVGTNLDVSAEYETRRLEKTQIAASRETEHFVALAAHDLRTPMRNIQILTEMLREDFQDRGDGKLELIDLLEEVAVKSCGLLKDVLMHTQDANAAPDRQLFELGPLCQALQDILDPRYKHSMSWPQISLLTDKTALQIVLRNLLDNAIKHGQKDHLTINITAKQSGFDTISIAVQDNGLGFENAGQALTENGAFRADNGYGLLSVKRLIMARGGDIFIDENTSKSGSSIRFVLPGSIAIHHPQTQTSPTPARKTG